MKNIRKIVAILAAVLMLCSLLPISAFAAAGDVILNKDFEDGVAGFERGYVENGYMVFDATTANWQNTYLYANSMKSDTMYKVTFSAKANKEATLKFKIQNDWASAHVAEAVSVTTEWQDFELIVNSGTVNPAVVLFSSDYEAGNAPIYNIDNVKIVETVDPALIGKIVNGDFSDNSGWTLGNGATIADGILKLENIGAWSEAAMQTVPVKANTNYEITWKSQCVSGSGVTYMTLMDSTLANMPVTSGQIWMTDTSGNWINHTVTLNTGDHESIIFKLTSEDGGVKTINIDDVKISEIKEPSFDGYITNGNFETGKILPWDNLWGSNNVELVAGHNGDYAMKIVAGGGWTHVRQTNIAVKPNTDYVIRMYAKDASGYSLLVKDNGDVGNVAQTGLNTGSEWTSVTFEFNSGNNSAILFSFMSNNAGDTCTVDDITMFEKVPVSNDGYLINGTFETGDIAPWDNLWGSCPKVEIIDGGKDSRFALNLVSGEWNHLRQTNIAVEANTDYKVTAWAKNVKDMALLVKDNADEHNLLNQSFTVGEEWTLLEGEFNSGDNTAILFSLMGCTADSYGIFDDIKIEKIEAPACEHEYDDCMDADCNLCGEAREPGHQLTYFEAVVATNCQETGHDEYWYCENCGCYFGDAEASWQHNPGWLFTTGECVRPEDAADCATVPCTLCGNDVYGYGDHDVPACKGGVCGKCGDTIEGYGCANYDTPACQDGVCYYCGDFVAGFGHENGAWAACCDGECSYGCGLIYPATEDHVDADADDYCDNCWSHLAHIDEDADGWCDICWKEIPVADIIYGDADGDGEILLLDVILIQQHLAGQEVELNEVSADADGDGEILLLDVILIQQYLAGQDVELGPQSE